MGHAQRQGHSRHPEKAAQPHQAALSQLLIQRIAREAAQGHGKGVRGKAHGRKARRRAAHVAQVDARPVGHGPLDERTAERADSKQEQEARGAHEERCAPRRGLRRRFGEVAKGGPDPQQAEQRGRRQQVDQRRAAHPDHEPAGR
ncbi:hypothetical protein D3C87_1756800 [compost metagenome]